MDLHETAADTIKKVLYLTLATVTPEHHPWNSPVYGAYDAHLNFYWASWMENTHSQNIQANGKVFFVIYNSTAPEGSGVGVYIQARAEALEDPEEIATALKYYYGRKNKTPRSAHEFTGMYPRRVYKAVPEKIWINSEDRINGNFVDSRRELKKETLIEKLFA
jgi:nitroimidazol reductase NimA-like FMN-containing flavoprotein (pyridoxamine 5'-phosphate oxidase superfamily)